MKDIRDILKQYFKEEQIESNDFFSMVGGMDSLKMVSIISDIEDNYEINIPMEYIQPKYFKSLNDINKMIEELK